MMRHTSVGIDIGTRQIKVVVLEFTKTNTKTVPKIIGLGLSEAKGLKNGYIINNEEAVESIRNAVKMAEKNSGIKINKCFLGVGGIGISSATGTASIMTSRADSQITELDIDNLTKLCEESLPDSLSQNYRVINTVPLSYKIDGKVLLAKSPIDMKGTKLEVKMLFVACLEPHINDLMEAVDGAGVYVTDVMASPIASSISTLTKAHKTAGCALVNIGAETVSLCVFENNIPVSMEVFPIGGEDITRDIALGFKISLEEAEAIKTGKTVGVSFSKKKLEEIISARLSDIFELIEGHLKKIGRNHLLPAGIFITGGTASIHYIEELSKDLLKLPSRVALINIDGQNPVKEPLWTVAYGLAMIGGFKDVSTQLGFKPTIIKLKGTMKTWLSQFLP
ncbi:MAG: cell division protein FtsA [Patescibacteria group bacterium]